MGGGCNWLRIVSSGGLWYKRCWTFGFCYQSKSISKMGLRKIGCDVGRWMQLALILAALDLWVLVFHKTERAPQLHCDCLPTCAEHCYCGSVYSNGVQQSRAGLKLVCWPRFPQHWLRRLLSFGMWCYVIWPTFTDVSEVDPMFIFNLLHRRSTICQATQCHIPEDSDLSCHFDDFVTKMLQKAPISFVRSVLFARNSPRSAEEIFFSFLGGGGRSFA
jgi:hypothetical protein